MEQKSVLFRESNVIGANDDVMFRLSADGGTGGIEALRKINMNRSQDLNDSGGNGNSDEIYRYHSTR